MNVCFLYYSRDLQHVPSSFIVGVSKSLWILSPDSCIFLCVVGWGLDVSGLLRAVFLGGQAQPGVFKSDKGWLDGAGHLQVSSEAQFTLN